MLPAPLLRILTFPARLYYGWRMMALGGFINAVANGVYLYGFSVFFLPISRDLSLTRAETSLVFSLARGEGAIEGPLAGYLIDRFGSKRMLLCGAVMTGLGLMTLSLANSYATLLLIYVGFIGLAYNLGFAHSVLAYVNTWFIRHRGLAMSAVSATSGLGVAVVVPLLALIVANYGWRIGALATGVLLMVAVIPAALAMKRSPESIGLRPDGVPVAEHDAAANASLDRDFTVKEGLRSKVFWVLALCTTLRLSVVNVLLVQFIPMMVWKGNDEVTAAFMLATLTTVGVPARLLTGWAGDNVPKNILLGSGMLLGCVAFVLLQFAQASWQLWLFVGLLAVVDSANTLNWALIGDYYGRRSFATLRGTMSMVYTIGQSTAPVLAGAAYDAYQNYSLVLWCMSLSYFVGALIFLALRRPAPPKRPLVERASQVA